MSTITLSDSSKIDISSFKTKDGEKFVNVRKFYQTRNSDEWLPTKQGITIPEDKLIKLLKRMKDELENIDERAIELKDRKAKAKKKKTKDED